MPDFITNNSIATDENTEGLIEKIVSDVEEEEKLLECHKANLALLQVEVQHFEQRYYKAVGTLYIQLDEVKAQIAEHLASASPQSDELASEAAEAREIATNTAQETLSRLTLEKCNQSQPQQETHSLASKPTDSARKMKKEIAKWTHPDLVQSDADKQLCHKIMLAVNNACDSSNMDCLSQILSDLNLAFYNTNTLEDVYIAHLTTYLKQVRRQLDEIKSSILRIESSDIFQIKAQVESAEKQGTDVLVKMAHSIQAEVTQAIEQLSNLMDKGRQ